MCNCIETHEQKIIDHFQKQEPEKTFIRELDPFDGTGFQNKSHLFTDLKKIFITTDFVVKYTTLKANGQPSKPKKRTINIQPNYCMFCGEQMKY